MASWSAEEEEATVREVQTRPRSDADERGGEEELQNSGLPEFSPSPITFYTFSTLAPVAGFSVHHGFTARLSLLPGEEKPG